MDEANRSNTAFYPVDPRGLTVFDEGIVPSAGVGVGPSANPTLTPQQELTRLRAREQGLRRLAEGTDGVAILGTNKIAEALNRVVTDLTSYYLLGYYSTESSTENFIERSHRADGRARSRGCGSDDECRRSDRRCGIVSSGDTRQFRARSAAPRLRHHRVARRTKW